VAVTSPLCHCCGLPFVAGTDHLCGECLGSSFAFDRARSLFYYRRPVSTLLIELKFNGRLDLLEPLAALARQARAGELITIPDIIIPVPLHIKRLRERGFNQSLFLARACLPDHRHAIRTDLLKRNRCTVPQTELNGRARRNNLKKALFVPKPHQIAGKRILVVDDVFTTGATLHECAKTLKQAGAARVEALTMARAL
jgi:ComF family protein